MKASQELYFIKRLNFNQSLAYYRSPSFLNGLDVRIVELPA